MPRSTTIPSVSTVGRHPRRTRQAAAVLVVASVALTACGDDERSTPVQMVDGKPLVVVTYSILGDVVSSLVGDTATVQVIVPDGQDPHEFNASARDIEAMYGAALVVANGLDLEEGMHDALKAVADDAVPVFEVTDHVTVRETDGEAHGGEGDEHSKEGDEHGHSHEGGDPHVWTSAATMAEMLPDLTAALETALAVQLDDRLLALQADIEALDAEVASIIGGLPEGRCVLVTGHESLGYFADRYGCTLVGAVIPSLSSTAEASAKQLEELQRLATEAGARAVFTELGTPTQVAEQVADAVGVPLVELPSHNLPDGGGYRAFLTDLATRIANALA